MTDNSYRLGADSVMDSGVTELLNEDLLEIIEPDTDIVWCIKHSSEVEDLVFRPTQCYAARAAGAGPSWGPCRIGVLRGYFLDRVSLSGRIEEQTWLAMHISH